jgi:ligand-binding SRPBCC domain-containing protein
MSRIELETVIEAPPERCFDLSRSVDLHLDSTATTGERVVAGRTHGLLGAGESITWEARHLGWRHRLSVRLTAYDRPRMFRDEMVRGPFRRMGHDHWFFPAEGGTRMQDVFEFATLLAPVDLLVLRPHLRRLLLTRNDFILTAAEGDGWLRYLDSDAAAVSVRGV